ncbi:MAG: hypothetical protein ACTSUT_15260 [Promethearchaeota archaeon]
MAKNPVVNFKMRIKESEYQGEVSYAVVGAFLLDSRTNEEILINLSIDEDGKIILSDDKYNDNEQIAWGKAVKYKAKKGKDRKGLVR